MKLDRIIAVRTDKIVYRDGDNCIKVFEKSYSKVDVLNEALNQARAEEAGVNVPEIKAVASVDGKRAIVSQYVKGKTLDRLIIENPQKKYEYIDKLVDLQIEVLSKTCPAFRKLKDKMKEKISRADIDEETRRKLILLLDEMPEHSKLCHGDFNPSNVIVSDDEKPYILDWSHVTQGNASADVARTYLIFWLKGDISGAEAYLDSFSSKTKTKRDYIEKWMPVVAAAQSVRGNPKEREFLLSWVKNI